jgi:hypothetical protein
MKNQEEMMNRIVKLERSQTQAPRPPFKGEIKIRNRRMKMKPQIHWHPQMQWTRILGAWNDVKHIGKMNVLFMLTNNKSTPLTSSQTVLK